MQATFKGATWHVGSVYASAAFNNVIYNGTADLIKGSHAGNTVAHEAGHQLDAIYGGASQLSKDMDYHLTGEKVTVGAYAINTGDKLHLTFQPDGSAAVLDLYYTVKNTDTTTSQLATGLANALMSSSIFTTGFPTSFHGTATASANVITITFTNTDSTAVKFGHSIENFGHTSYEILTLSNYDWQAFVTSTTPQCNDVARNLLAQIRPESHCNL